MLKDDKAFIRYAQRGIEEVTIDQVDAGRGMARVGAHWYDIASGEPRTKKGTPLYAGYVSAGILHLYTRELAHERDVRHLRFQIEQAVASGRVSEYGLNKIARVLGIPEVPSLLSVDVAEDIAAQAVVRNPDMFKRGDI